MPVKLEPRVVLKGKWLRLAGFPARQKVSIVVNQAEFVIKPKQAEPSLAVKN
ncbi:hypothetical protein [Thalassomonas sp. RHCl1]|uniref:hypothetical protein n=1 Tax=Thalassomonas sp. RHCl1 TaxID=2995320 RepID=UPI00248BC99D|nr:hypothetical protein [Thalassomonas sp. RHCl1]